MNVRTSSPAPTRQLRVGAYIRVSRADQRPALQADAITEMVERRDWKLVEIFSDLGFSGARDRRPGLDRLLASARRREIDVIVVWKTDRMARSLRNLINMLADFEALGVKFVSITEPFDTSVPTGALMVSLIGAFAAFERSLLIERTRAGMNAARLRGAKIGRPRVAFDLDDARSRLATGEPLAVVARSLGIGATTLRRAMRPASAAPGMLDLADAAE